MPTMILRMVNTVQPYAWGSRAAIPDLFGIPNADGNPMAEVWMGAHPKAPSRVIADGREVALDQYIEADPEGTVGVKVVSRFGPRLPFLFKILSAEQPLSIQAHPSLEDARAGFARENAAGIPRDAAERNYRDDNHKPELIYAVVPFWGMRGFRSPAEITEDFSELPLARPRTLTLPRKASDLAEFFRSLMTLPAGDLGALINSAAGVARACRPDDGSVPEPQDSEARFYWLQQLAARYPGDPGVLAPLFLNVFCLLPGEATYQPAGVLHAYLRGTGVELMANSDNVLRGGLTVKHVDLKELLTTGVFRPEPPSVVAGREVAGRGKSGCGGNEYEVPFDDFAFSTHEIRHRCSLDVGMPQILLCARGEVTLTCGGEGVVVGRGDSVFVRADADPVEAAGGGTLFRAIPGEPGA